MNETPDAWLRPMLMKRSPDALRILMDLIEAGLRKGEVSANDIRDIPLEEPNVIGGIFKILPKFGFRHTDKRVKTINAKKHSRRVDVWALETPTLAQKAISHIKTILYPSEGQIVTQMRLF